MITNMKKRGYSYMLQFLKTCLKSQEDVAYDLIQKEISEIKNNQTQSCDYKVSSQKQKELISNRTQSLKSSGSVLSHNSTAQYGYHEQRSVYQKNKK